MRFKEFLNELLDIEVGEATDSQESMVSSTLDSDIRLSVNRRLIAELNDPVLSPEQGIQKIRKVLHNFNLDMPALYDADPEGDEVVIELEEMGQSSDDAKMENVHLYFIYYQEDNGLYEFYAEVVREGALEELLSDEDEELEDLK